MKPITATGVDSPFPTPMRKIEHIRDSPYNQDLCPLLFLTSSVGSLKSPYARQGNLVPKSPLTKPKEKSGQVRKIILIG